MTANNVRAGPVGDLCPCSQCLNVDNSNPNRLENSFCVIFNVCRSFLTSMTIKIPIGPPKI